MSPSTLTLSPRFPIVSECALAFVRPFTCVYEGVYNFILEACVRLECAQEERNEKKNLIERL